MASGARTREIHVVQVAKFLVKVEPTIGINIYKMFHLKNINNMYIYKWDNWRLINNVKSNVSLKINYVK